MSSHDGSRISFKINNNEAYCFLEGYDHGPVFKRGQGIDTDSEEDGHSPQEMLKKLKQNKHGRPCPPSSVPGPQAPSRQVWAASRVSGLPNLTINSSRVNCKLDL